ncbi:hypothetical protein V5799_007143 [Amblyomma americanum]|uniref:Uncharacterized protein n=1 Tax=Amblyomma americanum TaxID=6943 RepID=A0AAQ4DUD6_AMBAM
MLRVQHIYEALRPHDWIMPKKEEQGRPNETAEALNFASDLGPVPSPARTPPDLEPPRDIKMSSVPTAGASQVPIVSSQSQEETSTSSSPLPVLLSRMAQATPKSSPSDSNPPSPTPQYRDTGVSSSAPARTEPTPVGMCSGLKETPTVDCQGPLPVQVEEETNALSNAYVSSIMPDMSTVVQAASDVPSCDGHQHRCGEPSTKKRRRGSTEDTCTVDRAPPGPLGELLPAGTCLRRPSGYIVQHVANIIHKSPRRMLRVQHIYEALRPRQWIMPKKEEQGRPNETAEALNFASDLGPVPSPARTPPDLEPPRDIRMSSVPTAGASQVPIVSSQSQEETSTSSSPLPVLLSRTTQATPKSSPSDFNPPSPTPQYRDTGVSSSAPARTEPTPVGMCTGLKETPTVNCPGPLPVQTSHCLHYASPFHTAGPGDNYSLSWGPHARVGNVLSEDNFYSGRPYGTHGTQSPPRPPTIIHSAWRRPELRWTPTDASFVQLLPQREPPLSRQEPLSRRERPASPQELSPQQYRQSLLQEDLLSEHEQPLLRSCRPQQQGMPRVELDAIRLNGRPYVVRNARRSADDPRLVIIECYAALERPT